MKNLDGPNALSGEEFSALLSLSSFQQQYQAKQVQRFSYLLSGKDGAAELSYEALEAWEQRMKQTITAYSPETSGPS